MIEVTIDSLRISLMSQHRVVVLREENSERYLPIGSAPPKRTPSLCVYKAFKWNGR